MTFNKTRLYVYQLIMVTISNRHSKKKQHKVLINRLYTMGSLKIAVKS